MKPPAGETLEKERPSSSSEQPAEESDPHFLTGDPRAARREHPPVVSPVDHPEGGHQVGESHVLRKNQHTGYALRPYARLVSGVFILCQQEE